MEKIQNETERRRLGQQMLLDKQKKNEELLRKQGEDLRRDKIEQQKLQEKLKAQIQQDREDKRRKYEQEQAPPEQPKIAATTTKEKETPKTYTRARLQFRLSDGSFYTDDFPLDARMKDVYDYLQETLPANQYKTGSYILRTGHTRVTLTRDNPSTLQELELVPSTVLLVLNRGNTASSTSTAPTASPLSLVNFSPNALFQSVSLAFTWLMMQLNFIFRYISTTVFGGGAPQQTRNTNNPSVRRPDQDNNSQRSPPKTGNNNPRSSPKTDNDNFKTDSNDKSNVRRFHNTQDDSDDEEKRTWNGNSTEQM